MHRPSPTLPVTVALAALLVAGCADNGAEQTPMEDLGTEGDDRTLEPDPPSEGADADDSPGADTPDRDADQDDVDQDG